MKVGAIFLLLGLSATVSGLAQTSGDSTAQINAHQQRAHQLLSEKKPELAATEFAAVVALDPQNVDAQANLGVLLYFQHKYAEAEPHLRAAIDQKPDLTRIRALLGMCERRLGKADQARRDLEAVVGQLDDMPIRVEVGLELIEMDTASQDLAKAALVVETLRQAAPTDPRVLYAAYRIYTDLSGEALLGLSVAAPESGQMYQAMAHELVRQRDLNGAMENYRKAIAANPNLPGIHYELAEVMHASDDLKVRAAAEREYKLAVSANALDVSAITKLGDIAVEKNLLDEAAEYYKRALTQAPNDADALQGLAKVYIERNDAAAALPLLERATAADPTNLQAHYRLSTVYRKLNRPEDAKRELETYQKYKAMKEKLRKVYKGLRLEETDQQAGAEGR
jgi:Tfp pilus assembly protein PilF